MARLWNFFEGEPYLDNPGLLIVNRKRKKKSSSRKGKPVMRRGRKARSRRRSRRRSYRRNFYTTAAVNPRRRRRRSSRRRSSRRAYAANPRRSYRRRRRSGYRSNPPDILGFNLKDIAIGGGAIIAAPFVEKQLMGILPASITAGRVGRWGVKVAAAVAIGFAAKKLMGPNAARVALIGIGSQLVADAVGEFAPQLSGYTFMPQLSGYSEHPRLLTPGIVAGTGAGSYAGVWSGMENPVTADPLAPQF